VTRFVVFSVKARQQSIAGQGQIAPLCADATQLLDPTGATAAVGKPIAPVITSHRN